MSLPLFASVGGFIIDDILYADGKKVCNIIGGGGIFAIYGMRLWQPKPHSKNVGYIIHKGFDFPEEIDNEINRLDISLIANVHPDKHTPRGLNIFSKDDHRDFEYIHPIIRASTRDFPDSWIQSVRILHIISSSERVLDIVREWREREDKLKSTTPTQFLWEPLPWACLPENIQGIYQASELVDIITPNHEELASLLGVDFDSLLEEKGMKSAVEYCGQKFIQGGLGKDKVLVVRASKYGAMVATSNQSGVGWVPAFWDSKDHVIDVTGAGNTFCGGYAYGWVKTNGDPVESARYGAVSASYTVEQIGVPVLSDNECWNGGQTPDERLAILKTKSCVFDKQ